MKKRLHKLLALILAIILCMTITVFADPSPEQVTGPAAVTEDEADAALPDGEDSVETSSLEEPADAPEAALQEENADPAEEPEAGLQGESADPEGIAADPAVTPEDPAADPAETPEAAQTDDTDDPVEILPEETGNPEEEAAPEESPEESLPDPEEEPEAPAVPAATDDPEEKPVEVLPEAAGEVPDEITVKAASSETAVIQASKSSQETYVGKATTLASGPANPRNAKNYILDLDYDRYPTAVSWEHYGDYMQGVGLLYPGDTLTILPETDPNPGRDGNHGTPGKILVSDGRWLQLKTGDTTGPLRILQATLLGISAPQYYVNKIKVEGGPVLFNYSGSGNSGTSSFAVEYEAEYGVHDASYWPASTMVWVQFPAYHPVQYQYNNNTYNSGNPAEDLSGASMITSGSNPTVIWAEDLSCRYNPIDGRVDVGPVFTLNHPQIPGYMISEIRMDPSGTEGKYEPSKVSESGDMLKSEWRFFLQGALDFNWGFDNKKHGNENDPITVTVNYKEAKTFTLNAGKGKVDGYAKRVYTYRYRNQRAWNYWYTYYDANDERFDLADHIPVRSGWDFDGWYADSACTKKVTSADPSTMHSELITYVNQNDLFELDGYENCAENLTLYAKWTGGSEVAVTKVKVTAPSDTLAVGKTMQLKATVSPSDATDKTVTWSSSDKAVATVDKKGLVKALTYGKATITAKSTNGKTGKVTIQTLFSDVANPGKSYFAPVYWAVDKGITVVKKTFRPDDPVTRGEFVAFLWRLAGKPTSTATLSFTDVTSSTKFYDAIRWAVGKGIIKGYSDKTFRADNNVTRGETAVMIWRYAGKPKPKSTKSPFSDVQPSSADSYKAILWGAENGIIKGIDGKFLKDNGCTRGQVVTFLYRYAA